MRKIVKQLMAGVTALFMAATCIGTTITTAFAETATPTTSVDFTVNYTSSNSTAASAEFTYSIELEGISNTGVGASFSDAGTKTMTVNLPTYDNVGVYTYKITQKYNGTNPGVVADTDVLYLVVTAAYDDTGAELLTYAAIHKDSPTGTKIGSSDGFDNTYSSGSLRVTKEVRGTMGDRKREFTISANFNGADGIDLKDVVSVDKVSGTGGISISGNTVTFTLRGGESATINNIPIGMTYTVVEMDTGTFTTSYENATGSITEETTECTVINDFGESTVDTGINLDNLPYILILAGVTVIGIAYIVSRKKHDEEA